MEAVAAHRDIHQKNHFLKERHYAVEQAFLQWCKDIHEA
jgi:hypothetical protein